MVLITLFIQEPEHRIKQQQKKAYLVLSCVVVFCPYFCGIWILSMYSEDALMR